MTVSESTESATAPPASADAGVCRNCGQELSGRYCAACGQRDAHRLHLGSLFATLREATIARGIWPTFREQMLRPGQVATDFIAGKRRRYVNPLSYYIAGASAQLFMLWLNRDFIIVGLSEARPELVAELGELGVADAERWIRDRYVLVIQNAYTWLGLLSFVLPFAVGVRVLARSRWNLAETTVFSLYTVAHLFLVTALIQPITLRVGGPGLHGLLSYSIYLVFVVATLVRCFRPRKWPITVGMVAFLIAVLIFMSSLATGAILGFELGKRQLAG